MAVGMSGFRSGVLDFVDEASGRSAQGFEDIPSLLLGSGDDGLVITRHGKPVAHLLPYERRHAELIGSLSHKVKMRGDIFGTGGRMGSRC